MDGLPYQTLKQHSPHPLYSKAHLDHSSQNPSVQIVLSALESSLSFEDTNHTATAPNMAIDGYCQVIVSYLVVCYVIFMLRLH